MWTPTFMELDRVLDSLIASRAVFIEDGIVVQRTPGGDMLVFSGLYFLHAIAQYKRSVVV